MREILENGPVQFRAILFLFLSEITMYKVVALIRASDGSKGRISHDCDTFNETLVVMQKIRQFVVNNNSEILSIYIKSLGEDK